MTSFESDNAVAAALTSLGNPLACGVADDRPSTALTGEEVLQLWKAAVNLQFGGARDLQELFPLGWQKLPQKLDDGKFIIDALTPNPVFALGEGKGGRERVKGWREATGCWGAEAGIDCLHNIQQEAHMHDACMVIKRVLNVLGNSIAYCSTFMHTKELGHKVEEAQRFATAIHDRMHWEKLTAADIVGACESPGKKRKARRAAMDEEERHQAEERARIRQREEALLQRERDFEEKLRDFNAKRSATEEQTLKVDAEKERIRAFWDHHKSLIEKDQVHAQELATERRTVATLQQAQTTKDVEVASLQQQLATERRTVATLQQELTRCEAKRKDSVQKNHKIRSTCQTLADKLKFLAVDPVNLDDDD